MFICQAGGFVAKSNSFLGAQEKTPESSIAPLFFNLFIKRREEVAELWEAFFEEGNDYAYKNGMVTGGF